MILSKYNKAGELISTNAVDIINAANIAKDIGCDYFEVKPPFDIMHYLQKHSNEVVDITNDALKKISKNE